MEMMFILQMLNYSQNNRIEKRNLLKAAFFVCFFCSDNGLQPFGVCTHLRYLQHKKETVDISILPSFWFTWCIILGCLDCQFYSCMHLLNLPFTSSPNSTKCKVPDNCWRRTQCLIFYHHKSHQLCTSKTPYCKSFNDRFTKNIRNILKIHSIAPQRQTIICKVYRN